MFSNIKKVMRILPTTSATSASVERTNYTIRFIKIEYKSRGGFKRGGGESDARGAPLFFAITLKNYKVSYSMLN